MERWAVRNYKTTLSEWWILTFARITEVVYSLVPRPIPSFSMFHAKNWEWVWGRTRLGIVDDSVCSGVGCLPVGNKNYCVSVRIVLCTSCTQHSSV